MYCPVPLAPLGKSTWKAAGINRYHGPTEKPRSLTMPHWSQAIRPKPSCGTRDAESQSGTESHWLLRGEQIDCWRERVIRKRSRFVRRVATGIGPLDGTSPVAYSTSHIRSKLGVLMIALPVFFFAIYVPDRCRSGFLHDYVLPDCGTDMLSS
jgi:hypothetical protein